MGCIFQLDDAQLLYAGAVEAHDAWQMAMHTHPFWEFIYFVHGCGRIDLPHASFRLSRYHLMIYPPLVPHAEKTDPDDLEATIFLAAQVDSTMPADAQLLLPDRTGDLGWLCTHILDEVNRHGITPLAHTYTRAFLTLVERAWDDRVSLEHNLVERAVQYLTQHHAQEITVPGLAQVLQISESHLAHQFSARMGTSPMRYLQTVRIERAGRLLLTTDLPVAAIAARVGFSDPAYFTRMFKRMTGHAPLVYRKHLKSAELSNPNAL
jgi:AraC-like DNA-binding protein